MKTKDGEEIKVGMWVYDTSGIYEITCVDDKGAYSKEIIFLSDDSMSYTHGDVHYWLPQEVKRMQCISM